MEFMNKVKKWVSAFSGHYFDTKLMLLILLEQFRNSSYPEEIFGMNF